ncbi:MAG: NUDIX domain-containing protein [Bacteroidales bacterium]|nr:NUDIX domain-containing protein [Bacteroidales bacterium]MDD3701290.1 NUDIX domain-containing protein [Bacteroidales bacterium]
MEFRLEYFPAGSLANEVLFYAVMVSFHQGRLVCVRNKERISWEFPAGRREQGEGIHECASRELVEETGALDYDLSPAFEYAVVRQGIRTYGAVFLVEIHEFGELPDFEIAEVKLFDQLPASLTYAEIQTQLLKKTLKMFGLTWPIQKSNS